MNRVSDGRLWSIDRRLVSTNSSDYAIAHRQVVQQGPIKGTLKGWAEFGFYIFF